MTTTPETTLQEWAERAARMLADAAPHGSEVILFGSFATGRAGPHSDADFLVVEPEVRDPWRESVRLRRELARVPLSMDIIVVSRERFEADRGRINTLVNAAASDGKVFRREAR